MKSVLETTELHDLDPMNLKGKKSLIFADQALRVVSIKDSIMKFYISNGTERKQEIFLEL